MHINKPDNKKSFLNKPFSLVSKIEISDITDNFEKKSVEIESKELDNQDVQIDIETSFTDKSQSVISAPAMASLPDNNHTHIVHNDVIHNEIPLENETNDLEVSTDDQTATQINNDLSTDNSSINEFVSNTTTGSLEENAEISSAVSDLPDNRVDESLISENIEIIASEESKKYIYDAILVLAPEITAISSDSGFSVVLTNNQFANIIDYLNENGVEFVISQTPKSNTVISNFVFIPSENPEQIQSTDK